MKAARVVFIRKLSSSQRDVIVHIPPLKDHELAEVKIVRAHRTLDWQDDLLYFGVYVPIEAPTPKAQPYDHILAEAIKIIPDGEEQLAKFKQHGATTDQLLSFIGARLHSTRINPVIAVHRLRRLHQIKEL